jgi:hypothetical protein
LELAELYEMSARGQLEEALARIEEKLRATPDSADLFNGRGLLRVEAMDLDGAEADFDAAIALAPEFVGGHNNLAHLLLMRGDYRRGWVEYDWRKKIPEYAAYAQFPFKSPRWRGEPLAGRRVLVHAEQGHGDHIQFARFLAPLAAQGATFDVFCHKALMGLLGRIEGVRATSDFFPDLGEHDFNAALIDLVIPQLPDASATHWFGPYVSALPARVERFAPMLDGASRPLVGIVWKGNPTHGNDRNRSLTREVARSLVVPGMTSVNLQLGEVPLDESMLDPAPDFADFEDTTAAISMLDHVISVDTSVAHLAGAMGKPVTLLVAFTPDWRWRDRGETTPWYPSMQLARQTRAGDWSGPIETALNHARAKN